MARAEPVVTKDFRPVHRAHVELKPREIFRYLERSIASWERARERGDATAVHYLDCLRSLRREIFGEIPEGVSLEPELGGDGE